VAGGSHRRQRGTPRGPQLVTPVAFDQPDNARRAASLGLARTLPFGRTSAARLARELAIVMADPAYGKSARRAAETLAVEDGTRAAADALEAARR
jgi:UDP:flavonoid glycosyltransferase YjiC (YdhE family)